MVMVPGVKVMEFDSTILPRSDLILVRKWMILGFIRLWKTAPKSTKLEAYRVYSRRNRYKINIRGLGMNEFRDASWDAMNSS
jgi:hypothetical protein